LDSFTERRRTLTKNLNDLRGPQRLYMPGVAPLLDAVDPLLLADHPENINLWLPSALSPTSRIAECIDGLPQIEYRLRFAQAVSALHEIRFCRRLLRTLVAKTQIHISNTQKTGTRTRGVFDRAKSRQGRAIATYRVARKAINDLAPDEEFGSWKGTLQELKDADVRGPGREEFETSSSRFVQSWIWTAAIQTSVSSKDPDLDTALRVEWCKSEERAKRYEEEVELVVEEMRRTLVTFELNAREWETRIASLAQYTSALSPAVTSGAAAYAHKQAGIQRKLVQVFASDWYGALENQPLAASWLKNHPRPPEDLRRRLASNVKRYHSSPAPCTSTPKLATSLPIPPV
jgi:hypothetical protein